MNQISVAIAVHHPLANDGRSAVRLAILCIFAALMVEGCTQFTYDVDMVNYGHSGVLILQIGDLKANRLHPAYEDLGVNIPIIAGRSPRIPGKYRDAASSFGRFTGYSDSLPNDVEVVWELADLTDCRKVVIIRSDSDDIKGDIPDAAKGTEGFVRKSGCMWHPLPNRVFRQKLDMKEIRGSKAYMRAGKRYEGVSGSRYTLNITLIFIEDQVRVDVANGATNPWL